MAQMLAVRYSGAAQAQVYRNNNGTLVAFGNPFTPGPGMIVDSTGLTKTNLATFFNGAFYVVVAGEVRKYNPATGNWDTETLPAFTLRNNFDFTGLYVGRGPTGALRLFFLIVNNAGNTYQAVFLDPGGGWTLGSAGPATAETNARGFVGNTIMYRNTLHTAQANQIIVYDPASDSVSVQALGNTGTSYHPAFVQMRGRAFMARTLNAGNTDRVNIYEFVAGNYVLKVDGSLTAPQLPSIGAGSNMENSTASRTMFYDVATDRIILCVYRKVGGDGLSVFEIEPDTAAVTDLTGTVVPGSIAYPAGPASGAPPDAHLHVQVDNIANPAAQVVTIWLEVANGSWTAYQWNGNAALMTSLGSGGDRGIAISKTQQGGGNYVYDGSSTLAPSLHIEEVQARLPIPGGTRVYLRGYTFDETGGAPTIPDKTVGLFFGQSVDQAPDELASLVAVALESGAGTAPSLNADKMDDMSMDGASVYSMDWDAETAGQLTNGENHLAMARIEA